LASSALDWAGGHAFDDLPVEDDEHDQLREGDEQDRGEQLVVLGRELALEVSAESVESCYLHRYHCFLY
jgi:hypothetical protein